jgi:hypothetical protein
MTFEKLAYTVKGLVIAEEMATTTEELFKVLNKQQALLIEINNTFETGYFVGADYKFLWSCKSDLIQIQQRINEKALNMYHAGRVTAEQAETVYNEI